MLPGFQRKEHACLAILVDPDKSSQQALMEIIEIAEQSRVDYFFVGSSLLLNDHFEDCIKTIKQNTSIPVILFPGNCLQISTHADGILFLSLISGRNPDLLIGQHVISAMRLKSSGLKIIPTGYILVDGGTATSVSYMSNTQPIPYNKTDIATATAVAGELLGLKTLYLDTGSGAEKPVPVDILRSVRENTSIPLIVGGGIRKPRDSESLCRAGADVVVVGTAVEQDPELIGEIAAAVHSVKVLVP